ncbi:hypothetical protein MMC07_007931 [Pseudocyphellaria aurata]|nr:hypothetical protein [Pseudocyphellaria aurata]
MSIKFYYAPYSTSLVTEAVLAELEYGRDEPLAKRVQLNIQAGETRTPDYISKVNPNGRVPAIEHEGVSVWESAAITMYLGETFGVAKDGDDKPSLYPAPGPQRGEAMKWIVWTNVCLTDAGGRLSAAMPHGTPGGVEQGSQDEVAQSEKTKAAIEQATKDLARWLGILDRGLDGRDYLLGQNYCLADTHVHSFVGWLDMMKVDMSPYANIKAWLEKVGARPALKLKGI